MLHTTARTKSFLAMMAMTCCLLCLANTPVRLFSQSVALFKINPLSLFVGTGNLQAEIGMSRRWTIQIGAFGGAFNVDPPDPEVTKVRLRSIGMTPELRFYPGFQEKEAPEGFFMGGYLRGRYTSTRWLGKAYDPDADAVIPAYNTYWVPAFGIGGTMGYQMRIKEKFVLDFFGGPQFMIGKPGYEAKCGSCDGNERNSHHQGPDFTGLELRAGIEFGYRHERK